MNTIHDTDTDTDNDTNTLTTHDSDNAEGTRREQAPAPRRSGRRGVFSLATCLAIMVTSLLTLITSAEPASAAVQTTSASCSWGTTSVLVGVQANHAISNGHQWVSVRYYIHSPYGWQIDTGYTAGFWAAKMGTTFTYKSIYTGSSGWQSVYVNVAYWDGRAWTYDPTWQKIPVQGTCLT